MKMHMYKSSFYYYLEKTNMIWCEGKLIQFLAFFLKIRNIMFHFLKELCSFAQFNLLLISDQRYHLDVFFLQAADEFSKDDLAVFY